MSVRGPSGETRCRPARRDLSHPGREHGAVPSAAPHSPSWKKLAQAGDYDSAYAIIQDPGTTVRDDPEELLLAADAAACRVSRSSGARCSGAWSAKYPGDSRAGLAAFTLGRVLLDDLGQARDAAGAFATAYDHGGPSRRMPSRARSRLGRAPATAHGPKAVAARYLAMYPTAGARPSCAGSRNNLEETPRSRRAARSPRRFSGAPPGGRREQRAGRGSFEGCSESLTPEVERIARIELHAATERGGAPTQVGSSARGRGSPHRRRSSDGQARRPNGVAGEVLRRVARGCWPLPSRSWFARAGFELDLEPATGPASRPARARHGPRKRSRRAGSPSRGSASLRGGPTRHSRDLCAHGGAAHPRVVSRRGVPITRPFFLDAAISGLGRRDRALHRGHHGSRDCLRSRRSGSELPVVEVAPASASAGRTSPDRRPRRASAEARRRVRLRASARRERRDRRAAAPLASDRLAARERARDRDGRQRRGRRRLLGLARARAPSGALSVLSQHARLDVRQQAVDLLPSALVPRCGRAVRAVRRPGCRRPGCPGCSWLSWLSWLCPGCPGPAGPGRSVLLSAVLLVLHVPHCPGRRRSWVPLSNPASRRHPACRCPSPACRYRRRRPAGRSCRRCYRCCPLAVRCCCCCPAAAREHRDRWG